MFEIGDKIVCINNKYKDGTFIKYLELYKTYTIITINSFLIVTKEIKNRVYPVRMFILEQEYQISKRKEKILKLKECITPVIK